MTKTRAMASPAEELVAIRRREARATAVARTAAAVASRRSVPATLEALAQEIHATTGLVGVQVLTDEHDGETLHLLGSAGFPHERPGAFFARLMQCREAGADLQMLESYRTGETVVVPHRYRVVMEDPAWAPLREYHRTPEWDAFVSVPIRAGDQVIGVLNVYLAPEEPADQEVLEFLVAMAEQAGLAIDYARLIERERDTARREERRRLAADLHDSVVQQVFSMGMLTRTLGVLTDGQHDDPEKVHELAADLQSITADVLSDLRSMVTQLRPVRATGDGLLSALDELADTTHRQTGTRVRLEAPTSLPDLEPELAEDVFLIGAEALRNAVKHAQAATIRIVVAAGEARLTMDVIDDGCPAERGDDGPAARSTAQEAPHVGAGIDIMHQRAQRWGGRLRVDVGGRTGGRVSVSIPLDPHPDHAVEKEARG